MWPEPGDRETGRFEGIRRWWLALPWAMRINAALYALAGVAALVLLIDLLTNREDPRRVEVAQQATTTTPPATTAPPPARTAPPATAADGATSTTAGPGGAPGPSTTLPRTRPQPVPVPRAAPSPPAVTASATTPPGPSRDCRNSTNSACGGFSWDPVPEADQPVTVSVTASNSRPRVGENVTFNVVAHDPDHVLDDRCARIEFGDGAFGTGSTPCNPPNCPTPFGPWTPPPRQQGRFEGTVPHTYGAPGTYEVTVTFSNEQQSCTNPYSGSGSGSVQVVVSE